MGMTRCYEPRPRAGMSWPVLSLNVLSVMVSTAGKGLGVVMRVRSVFNVRRIS